MTSPVQTLLVPHLGGIDVGYRLSSASPDKSKPTIILFNPFTTTSDYYLPEFENARLCKTANLLAIEPLGHGKTRAKNTESFTYWDSAMMALQVMTELKIEKAFALGTSQGGWLATRMALISPDRIQGIIPIGSSMDSESIRSRELGCWNGPEACAGLVTLAGDLSPAHDFEPGDAYYDFLMDIGFGASVDEATKRFWSQTIKDNYSDDEGKRRICMAAVALASRDGLHERLPYIQCPVLWLQGDSDVVFSLANAEDEIGLFKNSVDAKVVPFPGGVHFLSWTHRKEVHEAIVDFVCLWKDKTRSAL